MLVSYFMHAYMAHESISHTMKNQTKIRWVERPDLVRNYIAIARSRKQFIPYYDRSKTLPHFLPISCIAPLPPPERKVVVPFEEAFFQHAEMLIKKNRVLNIFWSGGIDSTCILSGLFLAGARPDQIHVSLTKRSVDEYPWFFENIIKGKLSHGDPNTSLADQIDLFPDEYLNITGDLFGDMFAAIHAIKDFDRDAPWQDNFTDKKLIEFLEPLAENNGYVKLKTISEMSWGLKFFLQWQFNKIRKCIYSDKFFQNTHHFADDDDLLQYWSIYSEESRLPNKQKAREMILSFTKDLDYYKNKKKVRSIEDTNKHILGWHGSLSREPLYNNYSKVFLEDGRLILR